MTCIQKLGYSELKQEQLKVVMALSLSVAEMYLLFYQLEMAKPSATLGFQNIGQWYCHILSKEQLTAFMCNLARDSNEFKL